MHTVGDDVPGRLERLFTTAEGIAVRGNTTATLINLIKYGDTWCEESPTSNSSSLSWERVPGCMADVRVSSHIAVGSNCALGAEEGLRVEFYAAADSRVARGMIALLCQGLCSAEAGDILALDAAEVALRSGMSSLLPPGRLDGFNNMIQVMQSQVRRLIADYSAERAAKVAALLPTQPAASTEYIPSWRVNSRQEVAVLLSGGVDSSVALRLLQLQGLRVRAFYLKIWLEDELAHLNECPWEEDLSYAQQVCSQLGVPLETVSLQREYWDEVVRYTVEEARGGRTPNPDIMCNSRIKFGMFYEYVGKHFHRVATGHYAQVGAEESGRVVLRASPDAVKDQTYFLSTLRQDQLQKALFPIGHLLKSQVRQLAEEHALPTRHRKDSQGICFLGKLKFEDFIGHYLGESPGPIVDYSSRAVLGRHRGLWFHTVGQRKGVGLRLFPGSVHLGPWIVAAKDSASNTLFVTNDLSTVHGPRCELLVREMSWVAAAPPAGLEGGLQLRVKLRHGPNFHGCEAALAEDGLGLRVRLNDRDQGIAAGQFAAFYDGDVCLGAGVIA